jgi:hypothetical protein
MSAKNVTVPVGSTDLPLMGRLAPCKERDTRMPDCCPLIVTRESVADQMATLSPPGGRANRR